ncbi:hypothetical protein FSP39_002592 [Pinctada imbricata]|uniref:Major facilitator superfamily (MFS) profile domain-containing protein n=1 Tax=Pinctada imbricata TaxID=66713 RepID=A0AA88Y2U7_PINIB|nr:hypothetical protein FSP39_002592 [Pinctada imbricata]
MDSNIDVDELFRVLGITRRYTVFQQILILVTSLPCAMNLMSYVFIGYRPPYRCAELSDSVINQRVSPSSVWKQNYTYTMTYDKCHVNLQWNGTNTTGEDTFECPNGYQYDIPKERSFVSEWDLVCEGAERSELSQSLLLFGQAFGALVFTQLSDKLGRKPILIFSHICLFLVAISISFVPVFTAFMILRFFIGCLQQGVGLCNACIYLEMYPSEHRYKMEVLGLTSWTTGVVLMAPVAYLLQQYSWRYTQLAVSLFSFYSLFHYWMADESIRWLLANGKTKEAERIIRKAARWNKLDFDDVIRRSKAKPLKEESEKLVSEDIVLQNYEMKDNESGPEKTKEINGDISYKDGSMQIKAYTVIDIFKNRHVLLISLICSFAWITNSLTYYGLMLISSTLSGNRFLNYFLLAIVEYPSALAELLLIGRYGRRWACFILHAIAGISLLIACILNLYKDISVMGTLSTVFSLIGKFGITGSFSTIFLFTPELFPTNLRNVGLGFASTAARVGGILAPFAGTLAERVAWGPGVIFTVMCLTTSFLVLFLPETTGRTLPTTIEELNVWYRDHGGICQGRTKTEKGHVDEVRYQTPKESV